MGRLLRWVLFCLLVPVVALAQEARPAETPPADFVARQYIDSRGCVFLRDASGGWGPRLARDGAPICGYPPTMTMRGSGGKPKLSVLDPDAGKTRAELLEETLTKTLVTNLQPGELSSDARAPEKLPDMGPEPSPQEPLRDLRVALQAAPAIRQGMGRDLQPNRRLCELLGYDGKRPAAGGIGRDPTGGYCGSLPDTDLSRLSFTRPAGASLTTKPDPEQQPEAQPVQSVAENPPPVAVPKVAVAVAAKPAAPTGSARDKPTEISSRAQLPARATPPVTGPAASGVGMIPPGARYIQIGTFPDLANADSVAKRVIKLGYPVLRGHDRRKGAQAQLLIAGPFPNREAIVRALDGLRKAGFTDAYPR